jgi:hypothetical protein
VTVSFIGGGNGSTARNWLSNVLRQSLSYGCLMLNQQYHGENNLHLIARVQPKMINLVFVASILSLQH